MEIAIEKIFSVPKNKICSKQPVGATHSSTFFIDLSKLDHRADVRTDDLGIRINEECVLSTVVFSLRITRSQGFRSSFPNRQLRVPQFIVLKDHIGTMQKIQSLYGVSSKLKVSMYSETSINFHIAFLCIDHMQIMHPVCILQYFHPSEANIKCRAHKDTKKVAGNHVRTKKSVLMKVKEEAVGQFH